MSKPDSSRDRLENFGGNIQFTPQQIYAPRTEADVLEILNYHGGGRIRPVGGLHAGSEIILAEDVLVSLSHFKQFAIEQAPDGAVIATVGAGLTLKELLPLLRAEGGVTLPTMPDTLVQTLAGGISTAAHGSGAPSLSHFVVGVRMAAYDPATGQATIYDWQDGPELRAARCALGFMGVILSLKMRCIPDFSVLQKVERCKTLDDVLAVEKSYPLQEFALIPYAWDFIALRRRPLRKRPAAETSLKTRLHRMYERVVQDGLSPLPLMLFLSFRNPSPLRWYLKAVLPRLFLPGSQTIDTPERVLARRKDLFQHTEMELYIPSSHLRAAVYLTQELLQVLAGERESVSPETAFSLREIGLLDILFTLRGRYQLHSPVLFRRVLPEDTLISMTGNAQETYYTVSFFDYHKPPEAFFEAAGFIAQVFNLMYGAFPHWGKYFPLENNDIEMLFPELDQFRSICHAVDPDGVFLNDFARRVLGFTDPVGEIPPQTEAP